MLTFLCVMSRTKKFIHILHIFITEISSIYSICLPEYFYVTFLGQQ